MKNIRLTRIKLLNFKGIKNLELELDLDLVNIYGANETGKTSVVDAFNWLLFDKDSHGNSKFSVKTLDSQNNVIHKLDHIVEADILVDDEKIELSKMYKEVWRKIKGKKDPELKGNENTYYYNGVPLLAKDFNKKIEAIIPEGIFKLMANTHAFTSMPWKDQRSMLIEICGSVSQDDILNELDDSSHILKAFDQKKTLEEFKSEIKSKTSAIKKDLKSIPVRISEVQRNMPEAQDFKKIESEKNAIEESIKKLENSKQDKSIHSQKFYDQKNKIVKEIQKTEDFISEKLRALKHEDNQALEYIEAEINKLYSKNHDHYLTQAEKNLSNSKKDAEKLSNDLDELRTEFSKIHARSFDPDLETVCPCCGQEIQDHVLDNQKEDLREKFNLKKSQDLEENKSIGTKKAESLKGLQKTIENLESEIKSIKESRDSVQKKLDKLNAEKSEILEDQKNSDQSTPEIDALKSEKTELENDLKTLKENHENKNDSTDEVDVEIEKLKLERDQLSKILSQQDEIVRSEKRILELENKETELANELISFEGVEFQIEEYERLENVLLENKVNKNFDFVDFKMFHKQENGSLKPTCEALINGVPYFEANTASKINAGIDIINTLSSFYNITCPLFIDNRESVTETLKRSGQTINLIVDPECKSLKIK